MRDSFMIFPLYWTVAIQKSGSAGLHGIRSRSDATRSERCWRLRIAPYPLGLTAPHRIATDFEPDKLLTAINDYARIGLTVVQVRVAESAVRMHDVADWIRSAVRDREVAVPDRTLSAALAVAVET